MNMHLYSDVAAGFRVIQAADLNNRALQLSYQGDYAGAERLHLDALDLKLNSVGDHDTTTAITRNALGELYLQMGRIADAEEQLKRAVSIRLSGGPVYDAAVSIENLGRVYESKGDFAEARRVRQSHPDNIMVCGNYTCPNQTFNYQRVLDASLSSIVEQSVRGRIGALVTGQYAESLLNLTASHES